MTIKKRVTGKVITPLHERNLSLTHWPAAAPLVLQTDEKKALTKRGAVSAVVRLTALMLLRTCALTEAGCRCFVHLNGD